MARQIPICDDDGLVMAVMELEDEGLNNPATITVFTLDGNVSVQVEAKVAKQGGADGGMYPVVEFPEDVEFVKDEDADSETAFTEGEI